MMTQAWMIKRLLSCFNRAAGRPHRPRSIVLRRLMTLAGIPLPDSPARHSSRGKMSESESSSGDETSASTAASSSEECDEGEGEGEGLGERGEGEGARDGGSNRPVAPHLPPPTSVPLPPVPVPQQLRPRVVQAQDEVLSPGAGSCSGASSSGAVSTPRVLVCPF